MPSPLHFAAVWMVNLQPVESGQYVYAVTHLDLSGVNAPVRLVCIHEDFSGWKVVPLQ